MFVLAWMSNISSITCLHVGSQQLLVDTEMLVIKKCLYYLSTGIDYSINYHRKTHLSHLYPSLIEQCLIILRTILPAGFPWQHKHCRVLEATFRTAYEAMKAYTALMRFGTIRIIADFEHSSTVNKWQGIRWLVSLFACTVATSSASEARCTHMGIYHSLSNLTSRRQERCTLLRRRSCRGAMEVVRYKGLHYNTKGFPTAY